MYFRQILHEGASCASYLVGCPTLGLCAVVDPQGDPLSYIDRVEDNAMVVSAVVETHVQADHRSCARELAEKTGVPHYLGPDADVGFEHRTFGDGEVLEIGNRRMKAIHTPGHTDEHVSLLVDDWFVLTGDTLFVGDAGRVDLALEDIPVAAVRERALQLHGSLRRLSELPEWVEVYPGHYAGSVCGRGMDGKTVSTIGRETRFNLALKMTPEEFVAYQTESLLPPPPDYREIKRQNLGHDR
jgi:glyoxylase-like metal-dependent hydrolase (beta-lactamase superfamily II)